MISLGQRLNDKLASVYIGFMRFVCGQVSFEGYADALWRVPMADTLLV